MVVSSVLCDSRSDCFRFVVPDVPDVPDVDEEEEDGQYGDSESDSDEDLDSVSVIGTRDRRSGTGSTHSHDGSTHSNDSGCISDGQPSQPRIREKAYSDSKGSKPKRPPSAVPSEYSVVSDTSSLEEAEEKIFSEATRPLIVTVSQPENITEEITSGGSSQTSVSVSQESGEEETRLRKAYEIARELLSTEKHYVAILHLIDQVLYSPLSPPLGGSMPGDHLTWSSSLSWL